MPSFSIYIFINRCRGSISKKRFIKVVVIIFISKTSPKTTRLIKKPLVKQRFTICCRLGLPKCNSFWDVSVIISLWFSSVFTSNLLPSVPLILFSQHSSNLISFLLQIFLFYLIFVIVFGNHWIYFVCNKTFFFSSCQSSCFSDLLLL